jgi:hypothetical protein
MWGLAVSLVAAASVLALVAPGAAAPPEDVAAYCRVVYSRAPLQLRCLDVESSAADRVSRAGATTDRTVFDRCMATSLSWGAMEACLTRAARRGPLAPAGEAPGPAATTGPSEEQGRPGRGEVSPSPTVPQGAEASTGGGEPERPPRPISEADAERHLRGVLERVGHPAARCTKKQYWPGWASVCE